jgi:hypothetical protein
MKDCSQEVDLIYVLISAPWVAGVLSGQSVSQSTEMFDWGFHCNKYE